MFDDIMETLRHILALLLPPALMAMGGSAIRYVRLHRSESFSWGEFLAGMVTAGFAGIVMHCLCRGLGVNSWIASAVVAMSGYSAGQLLDYGQGALLRWLERLERKTR